MYSSFGRYLTAVRLAVSDLTSGVIDFDELPDTVDFGDAYEDGIPPREAARMILSEDGFFDFEFPEDADCGYDYEGRPIGG